MLGNKHSIHDKRGLTGIEVLIGVSIVALILVFTTHTIARFINVGAETSEKIQALYLAEEGIEMVRYIRDDQWSHISSLTDGTTYYLDVTPAAIATSTTKEVIGQFTRSFVLEPVERNGANDIVVSGTPDPTSKYVTVTVTWDTPTSSVSLTSIVADIRQP